MCRTERYYRRSVRFTGKKKRIHTDRGKLLYLTKQATYQLAQKKSRSIYSQTVSLLNCRFNVASQTGMYKTRMSADWEGVVQPLYKQSSRRKHMDCKNLSGVTDRVLYNLYV